MKRGTSWVWLFFVEYFLALFCVYTFYGEALYYNAFTVIILFVLIIYKAKKYSIKYVIRETLIVTILIFFSFGINGYFETKKQTQDYFGFEEKMIYLNEIYVTSYVSSSRYYHQFEGEDELGKVRFFVKKKDLSYSLEKGYRLKVKGESSLPSKIDNYHYDENLWLKGIYNAIFVDELVITNCGLTRFNFIFFLKEKSFSFFDYIFSGNSKNLLKGMLLGDRRALDQGQKDLFQDLGLSHIVVASGQNMAYILVLSGVLFQFVPLYIRSFLTILFCFLFASIVGDEPSIWRAFFLVFLLQLGTIWGRQSRPIYLLVWTMFFMSLLSPFIFLFDVGFQLSFMAFLGVFVVSGLVGSRIKFAYSGGIFALIGAQAFVLPILFYYFGEWNAISLVANLFVIFALVPVMFLGFVNIPFKIFGLDLIDKILSKYYFWFENILGEINKFSFIISLNLSFWVLVLFLIYTIIFIYYFGRSRKWV